MRPAATEALTYIGHLLFLVTMPTSFKRGFKRYSAGWDRLARPRHAYAKRSAAAKIQAVWRGRKLRNTVRRTMRQQIPTDYHQQAITMAPAGGAGGNTLDNVMLIPFTIANEVGKRSGDKVFFKGLTIKWSIANSRPYAAGNTPGKVRFGLVESRGTALEANILLYNPTNAAAGVNNTDAIMNHSKVKVIFDRTVTMGDADAWAQQGYRDHINVKTFTKCNQRRMYISNDPLNTVRTTMRNWYVFAIASGFNAGQIRVKADISFSYKDLA